MLSQTTCSYKWIDTDVSLPEMTFDELRSKKESRVVLCLLSSQEMLCARLEQFDEDDDPSWYTNCSEHWYLDNTVLFWTDLPQLPSNFYDRRAS